jgi:hypothetical protein
MEAALAAIVRFEHCRPFATASKPPCVPYPRTNSVGV